MKPLIIYHHNCADGYTAAWVAHKYFKGECDLHPGVYGEQPPDCTGRDVYVLDFSYPMSVMEKIMKVAKTLTVLDHHESAMKDISIMLDYQKIPVVVGPVGKPTKLSTPVGLDIPIFVDYDLKKSGAMLAWEHFNPDTVHHAGKPAPKLVQYVQDRDLWRYKLPNSRAVNFYIFSFDYTIENWDMLAENIEDDNELVVIVQHGESIGRKHFKDINEFIQACQYTMTIGGHEVPVLNCPYHWGSDAAHIMAEGKPFACYYYDKDGQRVYGLRSREDGVNVADIAKQYDGGGHPHAAGFTIQMEHLPEIPTSASFYEAVSLARKTK